MNRKVIIASDSTCDLSKELITKYDVKILPLHIIFGEDSYEDNVNMNLELLYEMVEKGGELPKTSAASPKEFYNFFKQYVNDGYDVFYVGIGANLSSTLQSAMIAADDLDGHVVCIDGANLSTGTGLLVLKACTFRDQGLSVNEIAERVKDIVPRVKSQFVVETLDYLHKGGRCSGTTRFIGSILRIKPMIVVREGKLSVGKKFIGSMKKAITGMVNLFLNDVQDLDPEFVFITHTLAHDKVPFIQNLIKDVHIENLYDTVAGSVIGSHCGKGTIGILYILKDKEVKLENTEEE